MQIPISQLAQNYSVDTSNRLRFLNSEGKETLINLTPSVLTDVIRIIRNQQVSTRRRGGGLTMGRADQFVFVNTHEGICKVKVIIKFKDVRFCNGECKTIMRQKLLYLHELSLPIHYDLSKGQRFVVDFGLGTIPVYIIQSEKVNHSGIIFFVEMEEMRALLSAKPGTRMPVHLFRIPEEALRLAEDVCLGQEKTDYEKAWDNYEKLCSEGYQIPLNQTVDRIEVVGGGSIKGVCVRLRQAIRERQQSVVEFGMVNLVASLR